MAIIDDISQNPLSARNLCEPRPFLRNGANPRPLVLRGRRRQFRKLVGGGRLTKIPVVLERPLAGPNNE
jgi:hypothetical protein